MLPESVLLLPSTQNWPEAPFTCAHLVLIALQSRHLALAILLAPGQLQRDVCADLLASVLVLPALATAGAASRLWISSFFYTCVFLLLCCFKAPWETLCSSFQLTRVF